MVRSDEARIVPRGYPVMTMGCIACKILIESAKLDPAQADNVACRGVADDLVACASILADLMCTNKQATMHDTQQGGIIWYHNS